MAGTAHNIGHIIGINSVIQVIKDNTNLFGRSIPKKLKVYKRKKQLFKWINKVIIVILTKNQDFYTIY